MKSFLLLLSSFLFQMTIFAQNRALPANDYLKEVRTQRALKKKLEETIIDDLDFKETKTKDVLDWLVEVGGIPYKYKGDGSQMDHLLTLSMKKVPLGEAFKYVTSLSNLQCKFTGSEIVITSIAAGE